MATLSEAQAHRDTVTDLTTLAVAELVAEWPGLPLDDPERVRRLLAELLADLVESWHPTVAVLGVDWYEDLREAAGVPGIYSPPMPELPSLEQIQATASWASSALYVDTEKALADAATAMDRILANADREAIEGAVDSDPQPTRWARYASPNACAFCALLATRGPRYRSEDTAGGKYHNLCRCIAVPVWNPSDYDEAPFVAEWREVYDQAAKNLGRGAGLKAYLAEMRALGGLR